MYPDDLFKTWSIEICNWSYDDTITYEILREKFYYILNLTRDLTCDIGHSDMILMFDEEERFHLAIDIMNHHKLNNYFRVRD